MRDPAYVPVEVAGQPARPSSFDVTRDRASFRWQVRGAVLGVLAAVAGRDWEEAAERLAEAGEDEAAKAARGRALEDAFGGYAEARGRFRLDPAGRAAGNPHLDETAEAGRWLIAQVLVDADEFNDWEVRFAVDLAASRSAAEPVLRWEGLGPVVGV